MLKETSFYIIQVITEKDVCLIRSCFPFREYDGINSTNPESYHNIFLKKGVNPERIIDLRASRLSVGKAFFPMLAHSYLSRFLASQMHCEQILILLQSESQQAHAPNAILLDWMSFKCVRFD